MCALLTYSVETAKLAIKKFFKSVPFIENDKTKRKNKPPVKLIWYDGGIRPNWDERFHGLKFGGNGAFLVCEKGIVRHGSHGAGGLKFYPFDPA